MKKLLHIFAFSALMLCAGLLGYVAYQTVAPTPTSQNATTTNSNTRPSFRLPDMNGKMRSAEEWDGKWVLLNFWASWCTPCRAEMPLLKQLGKDYEAKGLNVVGIAVDDPKAAQEFAAEFALDFPNLVASNDGTRLARAYGNALGGLPFTVLINPKRQIVWRWSGELEAESTKEQLNEQL